jgi:general secretion pathway protein G
VPRMVSRRGQAEESAAKTDIANIETALNTFEVDNGRYPSSEEGLQALMSAPGNAPNWHGPYLQHPPLDPWKKPYVYVFPGQHNTSGFDLYTTHNDTDTSGNQINNWNANAAPQ